MKKLQNSTKLNKNVNQPNILKKNIMTIPCEEKDTNPPSQIESHSIIRIFQQYQQPLDHCLFAQEKKDV